MTAGTPSTYQANDIIQNTLNINNNTNTNNNNNFISDHTNSNELRNKILDQQLEIQNLKNKLSIYE